LPPVRSAGPSRVTGVRAREDRTGDVGRDATLLRNADGDSNDEIDTASRGKYRHHGGRHVDPMVAVIRNAKLPTWRN